MKKAATLAVAVVIASMTYGDAFGAVQTKGQQKCINGINKGMSKVSGVALKAYGKCTAAYAKDPTVDPDTCGSGDQKTADAKDKLVAAEPKLCEEPGGFGYTTATQVGNASSTEVLAFTNQVFGADVGGLEVGIYSCETAKPGCKCQKAVFKSASKLFTTRLKTYNKCKKDGLKDKTAPFDDAADLTACITVDPKDKIEKAELKLASVATKKCVGLTAPFFHPNSQCDGVVDAALAACLSRVATCHSCLAEIFSDGLYSFDCDLIDDAIDNGTCSSPD